MVGFDGISTTVSYLMQILFIYIYIYIYIYKIYMIWFGLVLWYINYCRLFNAKFYFKQKTFLFQTIQFSICTQFKCQSISISSYLVSQQLNGS